MLAAEGRVAGGGVTKPRSEWSANIRPVTGELLIGDRTAGVREVDRRRPARRARGSERPHRGGHLLRLPAPRPGSNRGSWSPRRRTRRSPKQRGRRPAGSWPPAMDRVRRDRRSVVPPPVRRREQASSASTTSCCCRASPRAWNGWPAGASRVHRRAATGRCTRRSDPRCRQRHVVRDVAASSDALAATIVGLVAAGGCAFPS